MRLLFKRPRTAIDVSWNAALQPMHRGYFVEDPIELILKRIAPGSRVTGGGSVLDDGLEVSRCDVNIEVTGDPSEVAQKLTAALESDYHAPRDSYTLINGARRTFGKAHGIALRITPSLVADSAYDGVPSNALLMASLARIDDLLGSEGRVMSWMFRDARTSAYLYGQDPEVIARIGSSVMSREFADRAIIVDTVA